MSILKRLLFVALFAGTMLLANSATAQHQVGDTLKFWSVSYIDWPPLWGSPQTRFDAVCKSKGDHCYVFVEVGAPMPSQSDMDNLVTEFDNDFYPRLTAKYGPVPDALDHDSSIFILALNENNWAGYFDPGQQMPDSLVYALWSRNSSEHEIIYVAANSFNGASGIVAHEFGHLLHWLQDHSAEPDGTFWETAFVDEGFSTFAAEYLIGNLDQHNVMDYYAYFQTDPDIPLIYFSSYDQAQIFMTFMFEHYGGWNYIHYLLRNQLNGWQGVDSTLHLMGYSTHFEDAFEQFCVANYIDDSVYQGGKYWHKHFDFPNPYVVNNHTSFPTGTITEEVNPFACDYITFKSSTPAPIQITFNGSADKDFRIAFIKMQAGGNGTKEVISMLPDASNQVIFQADSLGQAYQELVMVVMCTDTSLAEGTTAGYTYSAVSSASTGEATDYSKLSVYPNPASDKLYISLPTGNGDKARLEIIDSSGKRVINTQVSSSENCIDISRLKPGEYSVLLRFGRAVSTCKLIRN